jgi:hypothetical protein
LDDTHFLEDDDIHLYQSYIGVLQCTVELGRVDLADVAVLAGAMARYSVAP